MKKVLALKQRFGRAAQGQSLVEMAIITPILIFLLIGLFEVGWAVRGYLVLANANREVTRFAVRPGYLNFSDVVDHPESVGYQNVVNHLFTTLGRDPDNPGLAPGQLDVQYGNNTTMIVSHLVAETGIPCVLDKDDKLDCDCAIFDDKDYKIKYADKLYPYDDLVFHPGMPRFTNHAYKFPPTSTVTTRLDYNAELDELERQNNKFNCQLLKKGGGAVPSENNVIITEIFYEQPQLFGFPFISNPLTDPVPLYAHTAMRLVAGTRGENVDTTGPVCDAWPIMVYKDTIKYGTNAMVGKSVDIFNGASDFGGAGSGNDWGWLSWNPDNYNNSPYLRTEMGQSRTALNDYTNARDPSDTTLSVGDYVASFPGVEGTIESKDSWWTKLIGKTIRVPVWDTFSTSPNPDAYHIIGFAWMRIESKQAFTGPPNWESSKVVYATYMGDAIDDCK